MTPNPKTIDDTDVKAALERLDRALTPTPMLARQAVAEHYRRSGASGLAARTIPWINEHDVHGAPLLDRDAAVRRGEPQHAPNVSEQRKKRWWQWR